MEPLPEDMGDDGSEPEGKEPASDFDREANDVFDTSLPNETRAMALKEAIKLCMSEDYGSKDSGPPPGGGEGKGKSGLALILGVPKKK